MSQSKVVVKGYILVPEADLAVIKKELDIHIMLTLQEPGCLVFEISQDDKDQRRFNVYEEFVDQAAFLIHQQRVRNSRWGEVSGNVERHYQPIGSEP